MPWVSPTSCLNVPMVCGGLSFPNCELRLRFRLLAAVLDAVIDASLGCNACTRQVVQWVLEDPSLIPLRGLDPLTVHREHDALGMVVASQPPPPHARYTRNGSGRQRVIGGWH